MQNAMRKQFVNEKTGHKTVVNECNGRYFMSFYELYQSCGWKLLTRDEISKDEFDAFQPGYVAPQ